jgi:hypothetical protein
MKSNNFKTKILHRNAQIEHQLYRRKICNVYNSSMIILLIPFIILHYSTNLTSLPAAASETALAIAELETVRFRPIISSNSASLNGGGPSALCSGGGAPYCG